MLLQGYNIWTDIFSKALGSFLATFGAFLTWYFIEIYKKRKNKKTIEENLNKLYAILSKKRFYDNITADFLDIFDTLGPKNILKILKMQQVYVESGYKFVGSIYVIVGIIRHGESLYIEQNHKYYRFKNPDENEEILQNFMKFFINQCNINGFKIKTNNGKQL